MKITYAPLLVDPREQLELRLEPEWGGRWCLSFRTVVPGFELRTDWTSYEHCTADEAVDLASVISASFAEAMERSTAF